MQISCNQSKADNNHTVTTFSPCYHHAVKVSTTQVSPQQKTV